jgi:hypothetical protein
VYVSVSRGREQVLDAAAQPLHGGQRAEHLTAERGA